MKQKTGEDLRKYREELMLSKAELAKIAGVSVQTVHRIETGENFRYLSLIKIVDALRQKFDQCRNHQVALH